MIGYDRICLKIGSTPIKKTTAKGENVGEIVDDSADFFGSLVSDKSISRFHILDKIGILLVSKQSMYGFALVS